jgi:hypothetical protein
MQVLPRTWRCAAVSLKASKDQVPQRRAWLRSMSPPRSARAAMRASRANHVSFVTSGRSPQESES